MQIGLQTAAAGFLGEAEGMVGAAEDDVVNVGAEHEFAQWPVAANFHLDSEEGGVGDRNVNFLGGRDEVVATVGVLAQHAGEQLDQRHAADRTARIHPNAVGADGHANIAAIGRVPALDRRRAFATLGLQQGFEARDARGGVHCGRRSLRQLVLGELGTQVAFRHLSRGTEGQAVDEHDVVGQLPLGELGFEQRQNFGF